MFCLLSLNLVDLSWLKQKSCVQAHSLHHAWYFILQAPLRYKLFISSLFNGDSEKVFTTTRIIPSNSVLNVFCAYLSMAECIIRRTSECFPVTCSFLSEPCYPLLLPVDRQRDCTSSSYLFLCYSGNVLVLRQICDTNNDLLRNPLCVDHLSTLYSRLIGNLDPVSSMGSVESQFWCTTASGEGWVDTRCVDQMTYPGCNYNRPRDSGE